VKRHKVSSNKYQEATTAYELTTGLDFIVVNTKSDKRSGHNKFKISNDQASNEYSLDVEVITDSQVNVYASKVPWSSDSVILETSELTNVTITPYGLEEIEVEYEIEIIDGTGQVDDSCYGGITWDYGTRVDLGAVSITEAGAVTTATAGTSMVTVKYIHRRWKWVTSDSDAERVQFILVKP
jgi:hypothetical protein